MKKYKRTQVPCQNCSKLITIYNCELKKCKTRMCSDTCRKLFYESRLKCCYCKNEFHIKAYDKRKREKQGSKATFCSTKCFRDHKMSARVMSTCPVCSKEFSQTPWQKKCYRFCSPVCKAQEDQRRENGRNYRNGAALFRVISREAYGEICYSCRSTEKIEVHHLDRNRKNNTKENLRPLCRECHHHVHKGRLCLVL